MLQPKFTITKYGSKRILWVNEHNIWDLSEAELTSNVKKAILHSYFLGVLHATREMKNVVALMKDVDSSIENALSSVLFQGDFSGEFEEINT